jgi:hypothetical protein
MQGFGALPERAVGGQPMVVGQTPTPSQRVVFSESSGVDKLQGASQPRPAPPTPKELDALAAKLDAIKPSSGTIIKGVLAGLVAFIIGGVFAKVTIGASLVVTLGLAGIMVKKWSAESVEAQRNREIHAFAQQQGITSEQVKGLLHSKEKEGAQKLLQAVDQKFKGIPSSSLDPRDLEDVAIVHQKIALVRERFNELAESFHSSNDIQDITDELEKMSQALDQHIAELHEIQSSQRAQNHGSGIGMGRGVAEVAGLGLLSFFS